MTLNEAHPPAPIALDTNLFVRATVRRMPTCASPSARAQRKTAAWTSKTLSGRLRGDVGAEGDRRMDFEDGPRQSTARNAERPSSAPSPPPGPGRVSPGRRCRGLSRRPGGDASRMTVDERNRNTLPGIDIGLRLR